jgi:hypothetical protein
MLSNKDCFTPSKQDDNRTTLRHIVQLSKAALREKDAKRFIGLLLERNTIVISSPLEESSYDLEEMERCLEAELAVLNRLEEERRRLLVEMEELSLSRRACQKYKPKFPFPPTPAFLDRTT